MLRRAEEGLRASRPRWELPFKKIAAASLIRLRALRRRSERNGGFAVEARKRVELPALLVRLAAQHCNAAERAMPNRRSRVSGLRPQLKAGALPGQPARAQVRPIQSGGKNAEGG